MNIVGNPIQMLHWTNHLSALRDFQIKKYPKTGEKTLLSSFLCVLCVSVVACGKPLRVYVYL
ncbi:hypothetical protein, partial [Nostoc commune]|uniref:hypothetical protein n=1 Tax=Nostoc commune TaxID=1178 RepID=UPI001E3BF57B